MKKAKVKILALALLVALLCVGYFATPIRPAIAVMAANRYIQSHYQQYDCAPAEIVATGLRQYYGFEWIESYGAQSLNSQYIAYIELNGFFPFIVHESKLWQVKEGGDILIEP